MTLQLSYKPALSYQLTNRQKEHVYSQTIHFCYKTITIIHSIATHIYFQYLLPPLEQNKNKLRAELLNFNDVFFLADHDNNVFDTHSPFACEDDAYVIM